MIEFTLGTIGSTVTEGSSLSFDVTPTDLTSDTTLRWEIVFRGQLPAFSKAFSAVSGTLNFSTVVTALQTITIPPIDDGIYHHPRNFVIRVWNTKGTSGDISDDTQIGSDAVVILQDDETAPTRSVVTYKYDSNDNVFLASGTDDLSLNGYGGNDSFIITRLQYGDVTIRDVMGESYVKFDRGVEITGIIETLATGSSTNVNVIVVTLSTGAEVTIYLPSQVSFQYQIGDSELMDYTAFKAELSTVSVATPYSVTGFVERPVDNVSGTHLSSVTHHTVGADVIGIGGHFNFDVNGGRGDDIFVLTRFQTGNVTIDDVSGHSLLKFERGVSVKNVVEESIMALGSMRIQSFVLTLSNDARITIRFPSKSSFSYQFGDGETMTYTAFKAELATPSDAIPYIVGDVIFDSRAYRYQLNENDSGVTTAIVLGNIMARGSGTITYQFSNGTDTFDDFRLSSSGMLSYVGGGTDYETQDLYRLRVQAILGSEMDGANVVVSIVDGEDDPIVNLQLDASLTDQNSIDEGVLASATDTGYVLNITDTDGDSFTYSSDDSRFEIVTDSSGTNDVLRLYAKANASFDYENITNGTIAVAITVTDVNDSSSYATVSEDIVISNVNEPPFRVKDIPDYTISSSSETWEYQLGNFFNDPENDTLNAFLTQIDEGDPAVFDAVESYQDFLVLQDSGISSEIIVGNILRVSFNTYTLEQMSNRVLHLRVWVHDYNRGVNYEEFIYDDFDVIIEIT